MVNQEESKELLKGLVDRVAEILTESGKDIKAQEARSQDPNHALYLRGILSGHDEAITALYKVYHQSEAEKKV